MNHQNTIPAYQYFEAEKQHKLKTETEVYIVGDDLRNPMNHGALIRLADNIGAKRVFFTSNPERFSQTKIQKTAGSSNTHMPYEFTDWDNIKAQIPGDYSWYAVETSATAKSLYETAFVDRCVFVVGNETNGLSPDVLKLCQTHVYIPVPGHTKSLNVSHAAAVVLFEWVRQKL